MAEHEAEQQGYELTDIQIKVVLWFGVSIVVLTFLGYIVSIFFVKYFNAQPPISDYVATPVARETVTQQFPAGTRLQVDPPAALDQRLEDMEYVATTFGVVSEEPEIYRIPVEEAMEIVANEGLPVFKPTEATPETTQ